MTVVEVEIPQLLFGLVYITGCTSDGMELLRLVFVSGKGS